ncbi:phosphoenolpyruvate--protein phosphotransferase [Moraxella sp. VT-16-12]|uniref:phosphoenolpyruvate--protein phosphotransferase n=1 Tax=Moraxella sp. VT-16-12 TaxID=2014877 RepID=UPI000B7FDC00|nr:phosphoenolpyruvate--protein phosphotransferase [Moraxella sp. VT-16-12]TWV83553.1 phosphoenolpyruvate--protein phosphotransferase [Moraxella sp. VT-16-12]
MLSLTCDDVRMNAHASSKDEALTLLAQIFVNDGLTQDGYLDGLLARENQANTYLGQGVAIPHGTPQVRHLINKTGVRLVHFADGVVWSDDGDKVYLMVGICAKSDEHLSILKQLTGALTDNIADKIHQAKTADDVISLLKNKEQTAQKQLLLHESLIETGVPATDVDELYHVALQSLKQKQVLQSALGIKAEFVPLSVGRYPIYGAVIESPLINKSALALMVAHDVIKYQGSDLSALAVIASNDNVDTQSLSKIYDVLMAHDLADEIGTLDVSQIAHRLGVACEPSWQSVSVIIPMPQGLHARPATALSELVKTATGEIRVCVDKGEFVSAKSLARLLSLGAGFGQTLTFMAEPDTDAVALLPKLVQAVEQGLGDDIAIVPSAPSVLPAPIQTPATAQHIINGQKTHAISASRGVAVGQAYVLEDTNFDYPMTSNNPKEEIARLNLAIDDVKEDLKAMIKNTQKSSITKIFTAHLALLDDDEIVLGAKDGIHQGSSAAAAWHSHIKNMADAQASLGNQVLAERAADLRDIGQKVLCYLTGQKPKNAPNEPYVLIKDDLLPSDVAKLDPTQVAGVITAFGGASSHSAIVARALGIACVVGAGVGVLDIKDGDTVLLDGGEGWFVVNPDDVLVDEYLSKQKEIAQRQQLALAAAHQPAITTDGHQIEIAVNIGNVNDTPDAVAQGAEAVGLLRTELVFMAHTQVPDISVQVADYTKVFDALDGRPLVVRTLDVGGDKPLPYLPMPAEDNPFLGVRGIRLSLERPELLKNQLIALIQASKGRDLRIMFPMVGRLEEWRQAKKILNDVLSDYPHDKLQVGIMIEVPSVAIMAEHFAKEVDFFSIGTNDLTQYTLAIDRGHPTLSKDADGLHPSILQLIYHTVASAHAHGKWVGVCGELAGDEMAVPILVGLGVDELSMSTKSIALTKALIRQLNQAACQQLAKRALMCQTAKQVRALVGSLTTEQPS